MRLILALAGALMLAGCDRPVPLPTTDTGRQDVERNWARDRTALAKCAARHAGTVSYNETLQRNLAGAGR